MPLTRRTSKHRIPFRDRASDAQHYPPQTVQTRTGVGGRSAVERPILSRPQPNPQQVWSAGRRTGAPGDSVSGFVHTGLVDDPTEQRLVLTDVNDADGTMWRAVALTDDGGLAILGHDLGPAVEVLGGSEYEFERRLCAAEVTTLRELLTVPPEGDLLAAIGDRFASTRDLEAFAKDHGIAGEFWSRIGD